MSKIEYMYTWIFKERERVRQRERERKRERKREIERKEERERERGREREKKREEERQRVLECEERFYGWLVMNILQDSYMNPFIIIYQITSIFTFFP